MRALIVAAALAVSSPAVAMSGAELVQGEVPFSSGYVFGVIESCLQTYETSEDFQEAWQRRRKCVINANLNSGGTYDAFKQYIFAHPQSMAEPAFAAVYKWMVEMCP